ncbi:hypothetical protein JTY60_01215 [symbiont of Argiope bruennichi]|uniref:hypothetical protein n=1 Tax=symbiont of Argiope bruennichi TaxID=2810479 RepID=UPI003DA3FF3C
MNNFNSHYNKKEIILGKSFIYQRFSCSIINIFLFLFIFSITSLIFYSSSLSNLITELKKLVDFSSTSFSGNSSILSSVAISLLIQTVISSGFIIFNSQSLPMFFNNTKFYRVNNKRILIKDLALILLYNFVKVWVVGFFVFFLYMTHIATRILAIIFIILLIGLYFWVYKKFGFSLLEILTRTKKMSFFSETKEPYVSILPAKSTILFSEIIENSFDKNQANLTKEYNIDKERNSKNHT